PDSGKVSAATLSTKEEIVVQSDEPEQPPAETGSPGATDFGIAGVYEGTAYLGNAKVNVYIEIPFRMEVAPDGSFATTIAGSGSTPANYGEYYWFREYRFNSSHTGAVSSSGQLSGSGTQEFDAFIDSRGRARPGDTSGIDKSWSDNRPYPSKISGTISDGRFTGKLNAGFPVFRIEATKVE
ncbi:MAG: hypothetical protein U1E22_05750, partial [Coriobacteriia bacterium]|nr:hypothetical protein [Coriobacteriia bacterium]